MSSEEETKQSPVQVKIRQPYTVTEKKLEQLRIAREKCKKKREEAQEAKVKALLEQYREKERDEERARMEQERIEKQAALDSAKITMAQEPKITSSHIYKVPEENAQAETKVSDTSVREVSIQDLTQPPALARQRNVVWEQMENAHGEENEQDAVMALQMIRQAPLDKPVAPQTAVYLPGTGAGNHAPFENEPEYKMQTPPQPPLVRSRPRAIPQYAPPPQQGLDEQSIRFLATLPRHTATRVLAAMMHEDENDAPIMIPQKRHMSTQPPRVADDFMSHARVAQSYHPSRLQQSLHPAYPEPGSQFVWM